MDIEVQNNFQVLIRIKGEFFDLDSRRKGNPEVAGPKATKVTGSELIELSQRRGCILHPLCGTDAAGFFHTGPLDVCCAMHAVHGDHNNPTQLLRAGSSLLLQGQHVHVHVKYLFGKIRTIGPI